MNWLNARDVLKPSIIDFSTFGNKNTVDKKNRDKILNDANYSCRYCGGVYHKYLQSIQLDNNVIDVCCRGCYLITHLNYGSNFPTSKIHKEIKLYYSKISQIDIVKNTVNYFIEHGSIPNVIDVDISVKKSPISLYEYINILNYDKDNKYKNIIENYKIFFSGKLDTTFITSNYYNSKPMFIDFDTPDDIENALDSDVNQNIDDQIDEYVLTYNEKKILNEIFS